MAEGKVEIQVNAKDNASKTIAGIGSALKGIGVGILAVGTAAVGAAAASVKSFADTGSAIYEMSQKTGFSAEALSGLKYAAEQCGASLDTIQIAVRGTANFLQLAETGSAATEQTFKNLGLTLEDIKGLSPEATFEKLSMAIASIPDPLTRAATAQDVFGKSGMELLPLLSEGSDGIQKLKDEAKDLGLVMTDESAKSADEMGDAMGKLQGALNGVMNEVAAALIPALLPLADAFVDLVKALPIPQIAELLKNLLPPLVEVLLKLLKAIPIEAMISFVVDALSPLIDILAVVLDCLAPVFEILGEIIKVIPIKPFLELITGVLKPLLIPVLGIVTSLLTALMPILKVVFGIIEAIMKVLGPLLEGIAKVVGFVASGIGKGLSSVVGGIGGAIGNLFGFAGGGIVPGPIGKPRLVMAHGGEMFGGMDNNYRGGVGQGLNISVNVAGSVVSDRNLVQFIREELIKVQQRNVSTGIV